LAGRLLAPVDTVSLDQLEKMVRCITLQCGDTERRVIGNEIGGCRIEVGEIAAAAAGHEDLAAGLRRMVEHQYAPATVGGRRGAHQSCRTGTNNNDVCVLCHGGP